MTEATEDGPSTPPQDEPGTDRQQDPRGAEWLIPTLQGILALLLTEDNRGPGAKPVQPTAVIDMLKLLVEVLEDRMPPPDVVPTWRSGMQVEWHYNGSDLEIEANPGEEIEYIFKSPLDEHEGRAWNEIDQLTRFAQAVIEEGDAA